MRVKLLQKWYRQQRGDSQISSGSLFFAKVRAKGVTYVDFFVDNLCMILVPNHYSTEMLNEKTVALMNGFYMQKVSITEDFIHTEFPTCRQHTFACFDIWEMTGTSLYSVYIPM